MAIFEYSFFNISTSALPKILIQVAKSTFLGSGNPVVLIKNVYKLSMAQIWVIILDFGEKRKHFNIRFSTILTSRVHRIMIPMVNLKF